MRAGGRVVAFTRRQSRMRPSHRTSYALWLVMVAAAAASVSAQEPTEPEAEITGTGTGDQDTIWGYLKNEVVVQSASRRPQSLYDAPAAVTVITHEEIMSAGI